MIDPSVSRLILQDRRIAYIIADYDLRVLEVGGVLTVFDDESEVKSGGSILDAIPELVGSETVLADVLDGNLPHFQLEHINRPAHDGTTRYLTVAVLPHQSKRMGTGLLILVADTSDQGQNVQELTQQRNELRLLQSLAKASKRPN